MKASFYHVIKLDIPLIAAVASKIGGVTASVTAY
jgi:hypothetical protein